MRSSIDRRSFIRSISIDRCRSMIDRRSRSSTSFILNRSTHSFVVFIHSSSRRRAIIRSRSRSSFSIVDLDRRSTRASIVDRRYRSSSIDLDDRLIDLVDRRLDGRPRSYVVVDDSSTSIVTRRRHLSRAAGRRPGSSRPLVIRSRDLDLDRRSRSFVRSSELVDRRSSIVDRRSSIIRSRRSSSSIVDRSSMTRLVVDGLGVDYIRRRRYRRHSSISSSSMKLFDVRLVDIDVDGRRHSSTHSFIRSFVIHSSSSMGDLILETNGRRWKGVDDASSFIRRSFHFIRHSFDGNHSE